MVLLLGHHALMVKSSPRSAFKLLLKDPLVVDIVSENSEKKALALQLFHQEIEKIRQSDFRLKKNYLNIDLDKFYSFTVLLAGQELVAFSGLQKPGPWHSRVARISTRLYIAEKFRYSSDGLKAYKMGEASSPEYHPGSAFLTPYQLNVARKLDLDGVFLTRENPKARKTLYLMAKNCSEFDPTHPHYEVLEHVVNVCPQHNSAGKFIGINDDSSCWQNAIVVRLKPEFDLGLPERKL